MHTSSSCLQNTYDKLWQSAVAAFHSGEIQLDQQLVDRQNDQRRGFSLIIRPDRHVATRIFQFFGEIQALEPEQYYYQPQELHLTILSLFSATEHHEQHIPNIPVYASIFRSLFTTIRPFQIHFRGITASKGAVMVQGFPENDAINRNSRSLTLRVEETWAGGHSGHTLSYYNCPFYGNTILYAAQRFLFLIKGIITLQRLRFWPILLLNRSMGQK